jgi:hypothetical protein
MLHFDGYYNSLFAKDEIHFLVASRRSGAVVFTIPRSLACA